jgi:uncharacterized protein involved in exopolysaccharide biosynthesis
MNQTVDLPRREISLLSVSAFLGRHKTIVSLSVLVCGIAAGLMAFALVPKYRAEVVFSPVSSSGSFGGELGGGSLGGLAALAGISLGGAGKKSDESIEYLRSRQFTREFIQRHSLMPLLFASKWDAQQGRWRDPSDPPTISQGVERFANKVRQITEDHRTGIVTLAIIWRDRLAAAQWANALIAEADAALRQRAIAEYARSIDYLKEEGSGTSVVEVQQAVYKTMETELKDAMLARTRDAYAFKVLDPAVARDPKDTDSPNKPLIIALGAAFGLLIGVVLAATGQRRARLARAKSQ